MLKNIYWLLLIVIAVFALALGSENSQLVSVNLLILQVQVSVANIMLASFIIGLLTAIILRIFNFGKR